MRNPNKKLGIITLIMLIIQLFGYYNTCLAGIPVSFTDVKQFLTHPRTIGVLDYASALSYTYYDARTDAGVWQTISGYNKGRMYDESSSIDHFHYNKNAAVLSLIIKGYAIAMQMKTCYDGGMRWRHFIARQVCQLFLDNFVWHAVYYHSRYGEYMVYDSGRLGSRYVIPFPGREIKIGLYGNTARIANAVELGIGIFPLFSFDFPLNFLAE